MIAHLSHPWTDAPLSEGTPVNLIAPMHQLAPAGTSAVGAPGAVDGDVAHCYFDHSQGLLVVHPDVLLSGKGMFPCLLLVCLGDRG